MNHASLKALGVALVAGPALVASAQLSGRPQPHLNHKFRGQDQDTRQGRQGLRCRAVSTTRSASPAGTWATGTPAWTGSVATPSRWTCTAATNSRGGLDWDLGALTYVYPGNSTGNTTELCAAATWGPVTAKYSHTVSDDYFGWAGASGFGPAGHGAPGYLALALRQEVFPRPRSRPTSASPVLPATSRTHGRAQLHRLQPGRRLRLWWRPLAGRGRGGCQQEGIFGPVNKSRLIVTLTKTL